MFSAFIPAGQPPYNPKTSLAVSLGQVADNLKGMPDSLTQMAKDMDKADDNLDEIQSSLTTMAENVALISNSLAEYQSMIGQSKASMENIKTMLTNFQNNLGQILNIVSIVFVLLLVWLMAAQVVIFSQGWELFQGTAGRMEGKSTAVTPQPGD